MRLSSSFYINNRKKLMDRLPEETAVLIFAGEAAAMCADTEYRFLPDRNFWYLTGLDYQRGKLILIKHKGDLFETRLYAPVKDAMVERWHGKTLSFEELAELSGIDTADIRPLDEFDNDLMELFGGDSPLTPASDWESIMQESKDISGRLAAINKERMPIDISRDLIELRMVKTPEEIKAIKAAGRITEAALEDMKKHIRPGVTELELYTALEYGMASRGSLIPAFGTITAIGSNSFYLHHGDPEGEDGVIAQPGDLIQIDVGARVAGYCADISRVYFVGDRSEGIRAFENEDRRFLLLDLITELRKAAFNYIRPGVNFNMLNEEMKTITVNWLKQQGIVDEGFGVEDARAYYWHNTGHHLGLDVHDCAVKQKLFEPGNCLAIEPGVYIPEWNVGFRIEDDVLVTEDGCELLTGGQERVEDVVIK